MALDGVTSFLRLKDVTITCKRMRGSLSIGGSSSVQWRKVGRSWTLRMCFRRLLCVRIEIDQLPCVIALSDVNKTPRSPIMYCFLSNDINDW